MSFLLQENGGKILLRDDSEAALLIDHLGDHLEGLNDKERFWKAVYADRIRRGENGPR